MLTTLFQMLYIVLFDGFWLSSQLATFYRRHVTVMPKDAHFVAKIVNLWNNGSFLCQFISGQGLAARDYQESYYSEDNCGSVDFWKVGS